MAIRRRRWHGSGWVLLFCAALLLTTETYAFQMSAGVAKGVITNEASLVMVNGRMSEGTLKDIYARVLTLYDGNRRLVIVTYDLNCLDVATPLLRKRLERELGIGTEYLILLATHNHNAPIQIVPDNFEYGRRLADQMFGLIQEAIANERGPAKVEFGFGDGYFIFSTGNAPVDYEIQVLKISRNDQPIAVLFNHGAHPAQASMSKVGPGHPGWAMDEIEAALPGVQAMYADASGGNQFVMPFKDYRTRIAQLRQEGPEAIDAYLEEVTKETAHKLAQATLTILDGNLIDVTGPITSSMEVFALPLAPPLPEEEARALAEETPMDVGFVPYPHPDRGTNWIRMLIRYYDEGLVFPTTTTDMVCSDDTYLIHKSDEAFLNKYDHSIDDHLPAIYNETIVAKIGPMPLVAMQGEVCAPIGARIKDRFRAERPIFVSAYMGEHNLYIPTRELVRQQAYQARVIQIQYASPVGWDPSVEDEMVNGVIDMVEKILDEGEN